MSTIKPKLPETTLQPTVETEAKPAAQETAKAPVQAEAKELSADAKKLITGPETKDAEAKDGKKMNQAETLMFNRSGWKDEKAQKEAAREALKAVIEAEGGKSFKVDADPPQAVALYGVIAPEPDVVVRPMYGVIGPIVVSPVEPEPEPDIVVRPMYGVIGPIVVDPPAPKKGVKLERANDAQDVLSDEIAKIKGRKTREYRAEDAVKDLDIVKVGKGFGISVELHGELPFPDTYLKAVRELADKLGFKDVPLKIV